MIFLGIGTCIYAVSQAATPIYYVATTPEVILVPAQELLTVATSSSQSDSTHYKAITQQEEVSTLAPSGDREDKRDILIAQLTPEPAPAAALDLKTTTLRGTADKKEKVTKAVFTVPFYSQFENITSPSWKKVGCGIASLAMLIDFHTNKTVSVDALLQEGIDAGAYLSNAGWTYAGLIGVSQKYGLGGEAHDLGSASMTTAYEALEDALDNGPVMVSVHYTFDPSNPIPHLVILNGIDGETLYYNDPAEDAGAGSLSIEKFKKAWKKRYIEFYPVS